MRIELGCDGREEAAAGKDSVLDVAQEVLRQGLKALETCRCDDCGRDHGVREHGLRGLDRGELELLLGAEMAKRPLLLMPTASASRAIESPSRPSTVASFAASWRIALRLRSPSLRRRRTGLSDSGWVRVSLIA